MKKKLLCGVLSLSLILGVLTGCGDTAKEISSSESTKETVIEPAESTEENNEVDEPVAEDIEEGQESGEDVEFNTNEIIFERSITDRLFDSSYKDFSESTIDDLVVAIEDEGRSCEHGEFWVSSSDKDTFWGYDCYGVFGIPKDCANLASLNFIVDLGVGTEYKNNWEMLLTDLRKQMYDKNSEYHLLKPENDDWLIVSDVGRNSGNSGIGDSAPYYLTLDTDVTDAYIYLLDVSDVDNNYRDDYINLILSSIPPTDAAVEYPPESGFEGEPANPRYTYWSNWDSDCKVIKICTVLFMDTPGGDSGIMENTHGAEIWVKWYFLDNERFTAMFNEYGFTNPFE